MSNSLIKRIENYASNEASSNVTALVLVTESIEQLLKSGNSNPVVALMATNLKTRFKAVIEAAVNVTVSTDPIEGKVKVKRPKTLVAKLSIDAETTVLEWLQQYTNEGVSIQSVLIDELLPQKVTVEKSAEELLAALLKKLDKRENDSDSHVIEFLETFTPREVL